MNSMTYKEMLEELEKLFIALQLKVNILENKVTSLKEELKTVLQKQKDTAPYSI